MQKQICVLAAGVVMLSGCANGKIDPNIVDTVQQLAVAGCGFLPTVETVTNIIAAGNPVVAIPEAVAQAICAAVRPTVVAGAPRLGVPAKPKVNNVVISGKFVK